MVSERPLLWSGLFYGAMGSILFSAKAILAKLAYVKGVDPVTWLALRMVFAMPFFWLLLYWDKLRTGFVSLSTSDLWTIIFLGMLGYYFSSLMDFIGLQYLSAGLERIILYLCPTMVVLISAIVLKKKVQPLQWIALVLAYTGVVTVFFDDLSMTEKMSFGVFCVFVSALTYAIYLIVAGELVKRVGSIRLVCYASTSAMVCSLIQALIWSPEYLLTQSSTIYVMSVINALFCTVIPMLMVMVSVRRVGSSMSAQVGMVGPVATIFLGWWFLDEIPGQLQLLGTGLVLLGVSLLLRVQPPAPLNPEPE